MNLCPVCSKPSRSWRSRPGEEWVYVACSNAKCPMPGVGTETLKQAIARWDALDLDEWFCKTCGAVAFHPKDYHVAWPPANTAAPSDSSGSS